MYTPYTHPQCTHTTLTHTYLILSRYHISTTHNRYSCGNIISTYIHISQSDARMKNRERVGGRRYDYEWTTYGRIGGTTQMGVVVS